MLTIVKNVVALKSQTQIPPNPTQIPTSPSARDLRTEGKSQDSVGSIGILDLFGSIRTYLNFGFAGHRVILGVLLTLLLFQGCERFAKKAGGPEHRIVVLCEGKVWEDVEPALSSALEKEIFTPTRELVFELQRVSWENFHLYRYRRSLLILGPLGAEGEVSKLIGELLTEDGKKAVRANEAHIFGKEDAWAEGQVLLVITASEGTPLSPIVESQKGSIYRFFDNGRTERVRETIYGQGYQEEIAQELGKKYGWSINLPLGYKTAEEDTESNFISFIRHYPDRIIFVHWDESESKKMDPALCLSRRNYLGDKYLEGDEIDPERTRTEWVDFQGRETLSIKGIWRNDEKVMGGPFQSYCFYDEKQGRFYLLDFHLFAPGKRKLPHLKELDLISQTFRTSQKD